MKIISFLLIAFLTLVVVSVGGIMIGLYLARYTYEDDTDTLDYDEED